jgi:hypothetical protein
MLLRLERFYNDGTATLGLLFLDGKFECFTLEDEPREVKLKAETRIQAEKYVVKLRNEGAMAFRYATKFPGLHEGMLHLQEVPNFENVYLHIGNSEDHTSGCILVGQTLTTNPELFVGKSTAAYEALYRKVRDAAKADLPENGLMIEIIDRDLGGDDDKTSEG